MRRTHSLDSPKWMFKAKTFDKGHIQYWHFVKAILIDTISLYLYRMRLMSIGAKIKCQFKLCCMTSITKCGCVCVRQFQQERALVCPFDFTNSIGSRVETHIHIVSQEHMQFTFESTQCISTTLLHKTDCRCTLIKYVRWIKRKPACRFACLDWMAYYFFLFAHKPLTEFFPRTHKNRSAAEWEQKRRKNQTKRG